ncbi:MAG: glucosaminidase domain-containing protein [Bacteroidaceae bacterium]|nr:glucosaminidase domain-containing protein [Bacteroidaceae bacterium]MBR1379260.1 glucosaminidase domain-containing protein [Bacteroidaceae bacterium]
MTQKTYILVVISLMWSTIMASQTKSQAFIDYIEKYKSIAIEQMELHKIPASITLAQGLLESGAGSSELARKSNNHFGIKCGSTWFGPTYTHFDDGRNECFRVYSNVRESYEDHSQFLQKERYSRLFRLSITDYKGWAHGLKACGYATSPTYADRLISLIELYELNLLDRDPNAPVATPQPQPMYETVELRTHTLLTNNNVMCIRATSRDTWDSLAQEFSVSKRHLLEWNEAIESVDINEGDLIYLQKKQKKAAKQYGKKYWHHVRPGESMYSIAQLYGIRLKNLYRLNFRQADYAPQPGDLLKVR